MPKAKSLAANIPEHPEFEMMDLDDFVSDGSPKVYARVSGDGCEDAGVFDGDLLVIYQRSAQPGERILARHGDIWGIFPFSDDCETRRQRFYIVGREPKSVTVVPDEVLGVVAYRVSSVFWG